MQQNIELHIEQIVLHGFKHYNAHQIGEAIEREITRLLQEKGLPPTLAVNINLGRLNAGSFNIQPGAKAEAVGNGIANSIYQPLQSEKFSPLKSGK